MQVLCGSASGSPSRAALAMLKLAAEFVQDLGTLMQMHMLMHPIFSRIVEVSMDPGLGQRFMWPFSANVSEVLISPAASGFLGSLRHGHNDV